MDRGFFLTRHAIRRQLAAMPCELYLVRLIHSPTRSVCPGERLWTAAQLSTEPTIRFLRWRNLQGWDVYFHPWAGNQNAGYLLLDLDRPDHGVIHTMRANGHEPCVLLSTSPGHLQAWVHLSWTPLPPAVASAVARHLAHRYGADRASADWRHLGRLAGFTNRKPARCQPGGSPPWVRVLYARSGLATQASSLLQAAQQHLPVAVPPIDLASRGTGPTGSLTPAAAIRIYSGCLQRLRIPQRFSPPDWSIADLWIAKHLLRCRIPAHQVQAVLRLGSPGFPRRHSHPEDYLRRTLTRAALPPPPTPFSARLSPSGTPAAASFPRR